MSSASALFRMAYVMDRGQYMLNLVPVTRDIAQAYKGSYSSPTAHIPVIDPNNIATQPALKTDLRFSTAAAANCQLVRTTWYVNGMEVLFDNATKKSLGLKDGSNTLTAWAGVFQLIDADSTPGATYPYGGLRVTGNMVTPANGVSFTITCEATVMAGQNTVSPRGSYTATIREISGDSAYCEIYAKSGSFQLDEAQQTVTAAVRYWGAGDVSAEGAAPAGVRWAKLSGGKWVTMSPGFGPTQSISVTDVPNTMAIRAEVYDRAVNSDADCATATVLATDTQQVTDISDPYEVWPCPDPEDGKFYQSSAAAGVELSPEVRNGSGTAQAGWKFRFTVLDAAGTILNGADLSSGGTAQNTQQYTSAQLPYVVTRNMFEAAGCDLTVIIEAEL